MSFKISNVIATLPANHEGCDENKLPSDILSKQILNGNKLANIEPILPSQQGKGTA